MIPFDFEYHRPSTLGDAVQLYCDLAARGKAPRYYCGGTEIITMARLHLLRTGAVIDIKAIPECGVLDPGIVIGSAVTLTEVEESGVFGLLGRVAGEIADRTARNKITLGGNLCSEIIYREAVLPLLLADAAVVVAGPAGVRTASIHQVFERRIRLEPGEMVVQVQVDPAYARAPSFHVKRRRTGNVGYPVVTLAALRANGVLRVALSGACEFPFRSAAMEGALNEPGLPPEARVERALRSLPAPLLDDAEASAEYRAFVLRRALMDALGRGGRLRM